jgi:hypothetical protein
VRHAVVHAAEERHALRLEELELLQPRLAIGPADRDVVEADALALHAPLLAAAARTVTRDFGEGEVVVRQPAVLGDAAEEVHPPAPARDGLELRDALESDDLRPELVGDVHVADVQDEMVDAAGGHCLSHGNPPSRAIPAS